MRLEDFKNLDGKSVLLADLKAWENHFINIDEEIALRITKLRKSAKAEGKSRVKIVFTQYLKDRLNAINDNEDISLLGVETYTQSQAVELGIIDNLGRVLQKEAKSKTQNWKEVSAFLRDLMVSGKNLFWQKPWTETARTGFRMPKNYVSNRPYSGANLGFFFGYFIQKGFQSEYYLTSNQGKKLGGKLKASAEGFEVRAVIVSEEPVLDKDGKQKLDKNGNPMIDEQRKSISYIVYPATSWIGLKEIKGRNAIDPEEIPTNKIEKPQFVIDNMPKRPAIKHAGNSAFYNPNTDIVTMVPQSNFKKLPEYYSVLFHELAHSTAHPKRLNRPKAFVKAKPGVEKYFDKDYAREELVAEITAGILCGFTGIGYYTLKNSAAYLKGYRDTVVHHMGSDGKWFYYAMQNALKAADFMTNGKILHGDPGEVKKPAKKKTVATKPAKKTDPKPKAAAPVKKPQIRRQKKQNVASKFEPQSFKDYLAEYLKGKRITTSSWDRFADRNTRIGNKALTLNWLSQKGGLGLDQLAKNFEDTYQFGKDESEVIEAIVDLISSNPSGVLSYMKTRNQELEKENPMWDMTFDGAKKAKGLGIVSAAQMQNTVIDRLPLQGKWKEVFGCPAKRFDTFISGGPGCGKSTFMLDFANYLKKYGPVIFITPEEFTRSTLPEKVQRLKVTGIDFAENIPADGLQHYRYAFLDSVESSKVTLDQFQALRKKYPHLSWILIQQHTKDGKSRGSNEWPHEVDVVLTAEPGQIFVEKNRYSETPAEPILIFDHVQKGA